MSPYAPRIITIQVKPKEIGKIIGPKGATIRDIEEQSGAKVSIDDDGVVTIAAVGGEAGNKARAMVEALVVQPRSGKTYTAGEDDHRVSGVVEICPASKGSSTSRAPHGRTEKTEDVVKKGERRHVKCSRSTIAAKMRLSRKALIEK